MDAFFDSKDLDVGSFYSGILPNGGAYGNSAGRTRGLLPATPVTTVKVDPKSGQPITAPKASHPFATNAQGQTYNPGANNETFTPGGVPSWAVGNAAAAQGYIVPGSFRLMPTQLPFSAGTPPAAAAAAAARAGTPFTNAPGWSPGPASAFSPWNPWTSGGDEGLFGGAMSPAMAAILAGDPAYNGGGGGGGGGGRSSSSGASSAPTSFQGSSTGRTYEVGKTYTLASGEKKVAQADGTFKSTSTGKSSSSGVYAPGSRTPTNSYGVNSYEYRKAMAHL